MRAALVVGALALLAVGCSGDDSESAATTTEATAGAVTTTTAAPAPTDDPYGGYESSTYGDGRHWLCRPDQDDVCDTSLDATAVNADGSVEVIPQEAAEDPPVDCFYVYPTVSGDAGPVADFDIAAGDEANAALNQAARYSSLCRVFAPVYRQITVNGLGGGATEAQREQAYADVLDAWKQYISHDNDGRGVVLLGHSQGSGHLKRLIAEEIDGVPALQDRLVGAVLLGSTIAVPDGELVGGDFTDVPVCHEEGEVGCILAYSTFRATAPPPAGTYFGVADGPDRAACTNPAAIGGGPATLTPYFTTDRAMPFSATATDVPEITTPWVTYPDFLSAECVREGDVDWLELTIAADPSDPRTDDIPGDLTPPWGLHLVDANVAMGDLVAFVATQVDAYGS